MRVENQTKTQAWEYSRICTETSTKNAWSRIPSQEQQKVLAGLLQLKVFNFKSITVATEPLVSLVASDEMSSSGSNPFPLS